MWMECISDNAYRSREHIAEDIVRVLREELADLLAAGVALVQFDEPVPSEVVFPGARRQRSFMCGALSEKGDAQVELAFARELVNAVVAGFPRERTALHVCRGNWTPDESACLAGDYAPLLPTLAQIEADHIGEVLKLTSGNKSRAARILGISRQGLIEKLRRLRGETDLERQVR